MSELLASGESALGIRELNDCFFRREQSPTEVLESALRRIEKMDAQLGAFCYIDAENARQQALASTRRWSRGEPRSRLDGVLVALKDNIAASKMPSFWGAAGTSELPPTVESCLVTRLREAGAVLVGKTSMAEMGLYASGASSRYTDARNPWDPSRTAGGSSGGAAAAVAAGLVTVAIGSDGAGSVRMPASFCGAVGMKPTGGRVPAMPTSARNPVAGPIARSVYDAAAVMEVIAQPDARDHFSSPFPADDFVGTVGTDVRGVRIGYVPDIGYGESVPPQISRQVGDVVADLERAGATVETCPPVFDSDITEAGMDVQVAGLAAAVGALLGSNVGMLLPETRRLVSHGLDVDLEQYLRAMQSDTAAVAQFAAAARPYDVLITPTMPRTAFEAGMVFPDDAAQNRFGYAFGFAAFVHIANKAEVPACTVPCGRVAGLPVGLQVIGRRHGDADVLRVAAAVEAAGRDGGYGDSGRATTAERDKGAS